MTSVLCKQDILTLIDAKPPLLESYIDLQEQVQGNGIDLTLREVAMMQSEGRLAASNAQRYIPFLAPLAFDATGYMHLMPGPYIITYNEIVNLPKDIMALGAPRSSVLRCGVAIETAVWDAGYSGRSQSLMSVHNPAGFHAQKNARIMQLVFFGLTRETEGYRGKYQGENG